MTKKQLFCMLTVMLFMAASLMAKPIRLTVGIDDTTGTMPDYSKIPPVPLVDIEGNVVSFLEGHEDYTLNILDADGNIVYTVFVPSSVTTVTLPFMLGCNYELRLLTDSAFFFYASITDPVEIDGVYYILIPKAKEAIVTKSQRQTGYYGSVVIPDSVTYYGVEFSVTRIEKTAFRDNYNMTSVNIPNNVTSIEDSTFFGCTKLASIVIPNSVTTIGAQAFYYCGALTSVTIGSSVTSIGEFAFIGCSSLTSVHIVDLTAWCSISFEDSPLFHAKHLYLGEEEIKDLVIPNGVTTIPPHAFTYCIGLTSVTIPNSVTSVGNGVFSGCSSLASVTIPNSVTSIGNGAFSGCSSLASVTIPSSMTAIGDGLFQNCRGLTSVTIPNSVTSIGKGTFYGCTSLASVAIPSSVTTIGEYTFQGCHGLTSVKIPSSVTTIGDHAFDDCDNLSAVDITDLAAWCNISFGSNPLYHARHLYLRGEEIKDLVIPQNVTSVGAQAFRGCRGLTSVTIPNGVTSIGDYAFDGCKNITSVTISNSVTAIGKQAFGNCGFFASLTIPNSVASIGPSAFEGCVGLTGLAIPNSVKYIGEKTFYGCNGLTSISLGNGMQEIGRQAFAACKNLTHVYCLAESVPKTYYNDVFQNSYIEYATLYVPEASVAAYRALMPWNGFKNIVTLNGDDLPDEPEEVKCATPTIAFIDGELVFSCETEDVEYVSEVTATENGRYYGDKVRLGGTYKVSVYAIKNGCMNSDVATKEFTVGAGGEVCDVNRDGTVDVADISTIINAMASKSRE